MFLLFLWLVSSLPLRVEITATTRNTEANKQTRRRLSPLSQAYTVDNILVTTKAETSYIRYYTHQVNKQPTSPHFFTINSQPWLNQSSLGSLPTTSEKHLLRKIGGALQIEEQIRRTITTIRELELIVQDNMG